MAVTANARVTPALPLPLKDKLPMKKPKKAAAETPAAVVVAESDDDAIGNVRDVEEALPEDDVEPAPLVAEPELKVRLSKQLHLKLLRMAQDEGVALESLVQELLAEGVTLRAWEIIERKSAMRGGNQSHGQPQGGFNGNGNHRQQGGHSHGGQNANHRHGHQGGHRRPGGVGNAWMEDKRAYQSSAPQMSV